MSNPTATVQELYSAFGRGDLPAILAKLSDDVVWESEGPAVLAFTGIRHGKADTTGFFAGLGAEHLNPQLTIAEYIPAGDTVITLGRYAATAKATGKKFDVPIMHYWKFRDGKISRYVGMVDTAAIVSAVQPS